MAIFNEGYIKEFFLNKRKKEKTEEEKINEYALSKEDYDYLYKNFGKKQKIPNCIKLSDTNNIDCYAYGLFDYNKQDFKKFANIGKAKSVIKYIDSYIKEFNDEINDRKKRGESDSDIKHDSQGIGNPISEVEKLLKYKNYILKYPTLFLTNDDYNKENCNIFFYIGGEIDKILYLTNNNDDYFRIFNSSFSLFLNSFHNIDNEYENTIKYTKKKYKETI